ncbi:MAG: exonuclease domain-containing protein [Proteobacteria bacterium]|nr:exonuclease domain-containing protein [Pseudomonadota bacterium]
MTTRIICFDTETTGFDYAKGDRIIEIGAVEILDGKITDRIFHEYINPEGKIIPPSAYSVHKLSNEFLADKPAFAKVAPKLWEFFGEDSTIVAHNGSGFDFPFINYELTQLGLPAIPSARQLDSITLATGKVFGPKNYTLDSLAKWFEVSLATRADAHGALVDAEILAKVYLEIEKTDDKESVADIIAREQKELAAARRFGANFPRREFPVPNADMAAHKNFLELNVKDAIWREDSHSAEAKS